MSDREDRADALSSAVPRHTPGPWKATLTIPSSGWGEPDVWQIDGGLHAVCTTQDCFAHETEANVRLIAAAPDMYEALRAHDRYMRETGRYSGPEDSALHPEAAKNWRRILDVLSQATAKQERKS